MTSGKQWKLKRTFIWKPGDISKNMALSTDIQLGNKPSYLYSIAPRPCPSDGAYGGSNGQPAIISLLFVLLCVCKTVWFNRSARALGERPYRLSFLWYEMRLLGWHACSWMDYRTAPTHTVLPQKLSETEQENRLHISLINRFCGPKITTYASIRSGYHVRQAHPCLGHNEAFHHCGAVRYHHTRTG